MACLLSLKPKDSESPLLFLVLTWLLSMQLDEKFQSSALRSGDFCLSRGSSKLIGLPMDNLPVRLGTMRNGWQAKSSEAGGESRKINLIFTFIPCIFLLPHHDVIDRKETLHLFLISFRPHISLAAIMRH